MSAGTGRRRSTGRPLSNAASRPIPAGTRSGAGSRPDARRPGRRTPRQAPRAAVARRPLVTGRVVLFVGLLLLLALTLAGPVRQWLEGRAELARLAAESTAYDERIADLEAELARQSDPDWTAREARERLAYVLPGDRLVVVVDGEAAEGDAGTLPDTGDTTPRPWYEELLGSVTDADEEAG
ncbi:FtsB family cell division protein [Geodermatophilus sp. SYSU D00710]